MGGNSRKILKERKKREEEKKKIDKETKTKTGSYYTVRTEIPAKARSKP